MSTRPALMDMTPADRAEALSGPPEDVASLLLEAAQAGHAEAQLLTGQLYLDGRGVAPDPVAALRWFGIAANAGSPMAMNMVGRCCENGWGTGVDKGLAAQWYGSAAEHGLDWGMYNLATLCTLGEGVTENKEKALGLFEKAAALGHAKSINMVGSFYEDGWVVEKNVARAEALYRQAAEGGDFRGQFNHARMLLNAGDIVAARSWLDMMKTTATPQFIAKATEWAARHPEISTPSQS